MGWTAQGGGQGREDHYGRFTHAVRPAIPRTAAHAGDAATAADGAATAAAAADAVDADADADADAVDAVVRGLTVVGLKQEMGEVSTLDGSSLDFRALPIGTVLAFAPHHSCASGHAHPRLVAVARGSVVGHFEVAKGW